MKIALVHDYLVQYGGAERVLEAFCELWPESPIYTLLYDSTLMKGRFSDKQIKTSFLQKIPFSRTHHRIFPPLMLAGIEQFNFRDFDIVLSDSSSFAKNIITGPDTLHICYCHTPMRYGWDDCQYYTQEFSFPPLVKKIVPFLINYIRLGDYYGTNGVDVFVANSKFVATRIRKYYNRNSSVINPPVDVNNFSINPYQQNCEYFLMVGRMMKYKKMDLVVEAFNELKLPLKIVGRGVEYENLRRMAGPTIELVGRVSDQELAEIYTNSRAFIFPQEEDFGIVAIEALASGKPVIAYRAGDIQEHVIDGLNGVFFDEQTPGDLIEAVRRFEKINFNSDKIRQSALSFDKNIFKEKIANFVYNEYKSFKKSK